MGANGILAFWPAPSSQLADLSSQIMHERAHLDGFVSFFPPRAPHDPRGGHGRVVGGKAGVLMTVMTMVMTMVMVMTMMMMTTAHTQVS
jgi:hypothetical protein